MRSLLCSLALFVSLTGVALALPDENAILARLRQLTGRDLQREDVGFRSPDHLRDIVVIGMLAYDRGYMPVWVVVGQDYLKVEESSAKGLQVQGWTLADPERKRDLVMYWTREVPLAFEKVVDERDSDFQRTDKPYEAPTVAPGPDGTLSVTLWIRQGTGMVAEVRFRRERFTYQADGQMTREVLETVSVPMRSR